MKLPKLQKRTMPGVGIEPHLHMSNSHLKFVFDLKKHHFSFFPTVISRNSFDRLNQNSACVSFYTISTNVHNFERIREGEWKRSIDLTWNDPYVSAMFAYITLHCYNECIL